MIALTLPLPPSVNNLYRWVGPGRVVKSKAATDYGWLVAVAYNEQIGHPRPALAPPLCLVVGFVVPDDRVRRDTDNLIKVLVDAVAPRLGIDDDVFHAIHAYKRRGRPVGAHVVIYGANEASDVSTAALARFCED